MFDTLLESRARRQSSATGAAASITAHATLIAGAVLATMQVQVQAPETREAIRTVYFPPGPVAPPTRSTGSPNPGRVKLPATIQLVFPRLVLSTVSSNLTSIVDRSGAPPLPAAGSTDASGGGTPTESNGVFQESEVEKAVSLAGGAVRPRYPESLRLAGVEGRLIAVFVVDETGRAEVDSVRFTRSDNRLFEDAVKVALRRMQFVPAEIGGRKVRQLVQMPFVFTLNR
ncbi:MAG: TonB family protein [Gemmatimonadaceae bacterium]|jgi:protein TonB